MTRAATTLNDLIVRFEVPLPDSEFPQLLASLGEEARARAKTKPTDAVNARYFYLLGRVYELMGYCARHTPWLSNSEKVYWQKSAGFFDRAMQCVSQGSAAHDFLGGKFLFRTAMTHRVTSKGGQIIDGNRDQLLSAEEAFKRAADKEKDANLRHIYGDASVIAETEARQSELHKEIQLLIAHAPKATWPDVIERIYAKVLEFPSAAFSPLPSSRTTIRWPAQHALAKARQLFAYTQILDDFIRLLVKTPPEYRNSVADMLEQTQAKIIDLYNESAHLCDDAGLTIRAAHTRVTQLRRSADISLRECRHQFAIIRETTSKERAALLASKSPEPRVLPRKAAELLAAHVPPEGRVTLPEEVRELIGAAGVRIGEDARVLAETEGKWVISDGFDRYLLEVVNDVPVAVDLTKRPIPFNHNEAERFHTYAKSIEDTCRLYTFAIREINGALTEAGKLYAGFVTQLQADTIAARDPDLASLFVTTNSILDELESYHYPLLSTLRDRIRYAWSLLEMFEMRNGAVRLGTLFSGQCRLVMRNPWYDVALDKSEDEFLEVGADPIFETTIEFIFRGAKGEDERKDFQHSALRATIVTINQQIDSLLSETRYVDLDPDTRAALIARLRCHRSLADALMEFTEIFVTQAPLKMETAQIHNRLAAIDRYMTEAEQHFDNSGAHRSKLIDRQALDALHEYMKGVGKVLVGMNQHADHSVGRAWANTYKVALDHLRRARTQLSEAGDVDLLPQTQLRQEYLQYLDARILTVGGWQARYRGQEAAGVQELRRSAEYFEKSATIYANDLRDYRLYTKAAARAAESRALAEKGNDRASLRRRYLLLKEANALFAACGDSMGFNDTRQILQKDFSLEEAGAMIMKRAEFDPSVAVTTPSLITTFAGYEVELIEQGGMALVYRARKGRQVCALKRVRDEYIDREDFLFRFLREVGIGMTLNHHNIIRILDKGDDGGVPFFTMELLEGKTLKTYIDAHRKLPLDDAVRIVRDIAEALDYAHEKDVVHRDLKPNNVMLTKDGVVKVLDFGIATTRRFGRITETGVFVGTYDYAAPEQFRLREATERSDLYSLGLIFYELLTGQRALHWNKRMQQDHPVPSAAAADVPRALDDVVSRLLARDPAERYESAEELLKDLRSFARVEARAR